MGARVLAQYDGVCVVLYDLYFWIRIFLAIFRSRNEFHLAQIESGVFWIFPTWIDKPPMHRHRASALHGGGDGIDAVRAKAPCCACSNNIFDSEIICLARKTRSRGPRKKHKQASKRAAPMRVPVLGSLYLHSSWYSETPLNFMLIGGFLMACFW